MHLYQLFLTKNDCYKAGRSIKPKGIVLHTTSANNPYLKRYVGPDDGRLGKNIYNNHWNQPRPDGKQICCHGFVGKLADGTIATYQTLPWTMRGWHGGSGPKGSVNDSHIGFECCEDDRSDSTYFRAVWNEAVELCVHLCKLFDLDPAQDGVLIGHYEGHQRGIATNHSDPQPWFSRQGESMNSFRAAVKAAMGTATHIVEEGDTLWSLAVRYLGDGKRWPEIQQLNDGVNPAKLPLGKELKIPERSAGT